MSTPNPVVFTPLTKGFSWQLSTTAEGGGALPPGETESGVTIGIRMDGDTAHGPGNYQWLVVVPAGLTTETVAQVNAALTKALSVGTNYWAALDQTDMLNGLPATSPWTAEIPFCIPQTPATPASPTAFSAS